MITLRDYQKIAVDFLCEKRRAILGDDVGLGKTFPAIAAAIRLGNSVPGRRPGEFRVLVVLPKHLVYQWYEQLRRYFGTQYDIWLAERYTQANVIDKGYGKAEVLPGFYLTTYPVLQNSGKKTAFWLWRMKWDTIIFDEGQVLRNRTTQQTKNARNLRSDNMFILTGSPMERGPDDIFGLLYMCDRRKFSSYWRFVDDWFYVWENPWKSEVLRVRDPQETDFNNMIRDYMLRRMKDEYLDLKDPIIYDVPVELPQREIEKYKRAMKDLYYDPSEGGSLNFEDWIITKNVVSMFTKLRQHISTVGGLKNPKIQALIETVNALPPQQIIHYTWFRDSAKLVVQAMESRGITAFYIDGSMTAEVRHATVTEWKNTPNSHLVATMKSVSTGLDLQNAAVVIFYEHDYIPSTHVQAVGRVQRSEQKNQVLVYHIYAYRTIDEQSYKMSLRRITNIQRALLEYWREEVQSSVT